MFKFHQSQVHSRMPATVQPFIYPGSTGKNFLKGKIFLFSTKQLALVMER